MDILESDQSLSLPEAARCLPGKPSAATVWRWCKQGVGGVKLEYRKLGRRIFTSRDALRRFSDELSRRDQDAESYKPAPSRRPTNAGAPHADDIDAEAAAEGI